MRGKITKRAVDALAQKNGAEVVLWDQDQRFWKPSTHRRRENLHPALSRWNGAWSATTQALHRQARFTLDAQ